MKIAIVIAVYIGLLSNHSDAQPNEMQKPFKFKSEYIISPIRDLKLNLSYHETPSSWMIIKKSFEKNQVKPLPSAVCYSALFCKMEVQLHQHLNFWIKVRAGNFDDYEKRLNKSK